MTPDALEQSERTRPDSSGEATAALEFKEVTVRFEHDHTSDAPVLDRVSLSVPTGALTSVVGPSGCGKTTLLRLSCGLLRPTSGTAFCYGKPVTGINPNIGYVSQESNLYPWLTTLENVEFALKIRGVGASERRKRSDEYLSMVGLANFRGHYPHQLSGGMQKRASLIRTLIYEPSIVLMDEPFAALDALTRMSIQADLERIWTERTRPTVLFVTHDLTEAVALSDKVVVMGARPGVVRLESDIAFARPRDVFSVQGQEGFSEAYNELWTALRSEVVGHSPEAAPGAPVPAPVQRSDEPEAALAADTATAAVVPAGATPTPTPTPTRGRPGRRFRLPSKGTLLTSLAQISIIVGVLALWQILSAAHVIDHLTFSDPIAIARRVGYLLAGHKVTGAGIYPQIKTTLKEWALGYAFGGGFAIAIGFTLGRLKQLEKVFQPLILIFYGIPVITIAPLFVLVLGIDTPSKVGIGSITAFFAVFFQVLGGASAIPDARIQLARIMGANRFQVLSRVLVPSTLPSVFLGLRMAVPFTMTGVIIGEFVASGAGLGWFVTRAASVSDAPDLFAALFIIVVIVWILGQVLSLIERRALNWLPNRGALAGTGQ